MKETLEHVLVAYAEAAVWLTELADDIPSRYAVPALLMLGGLGWTGWARGLECHWWVYLVCFVMDALGLTILFGVSVLEQIEKERQEHDPLKLMQQTKPRFKSL